MRLYIGWLFCCVTTIMFARENPFSVAMDPSQVGRTTQIKEERVDFNGTQFILPSSARILKSASITFQNIDGSISEDIIAIDQNVDWHYPLVLVSKMPESQKPQENLQTALKKNEIKKVEMPLMQLPSLPKEAVKEKEIIASSRLPINENIAFEIGMKSITIYTKDMKVRDFLISNPYKVVVDFKKEKDSFATKTMEFSKPPFVSATLGDHDGFYRIAIVLDGHYRYDIMAVEGGYKITLK